MPKFLVTRGHGEHLVWDLKRLLRGPPPQRRLPPGIWQDHWVRLGSLPADEAFDWLLAVRDQTMENLPARIRRDKGPWARERAPQVVALLRRIGTPEASALLKKLAAGDPASPYTAAARAK